jgi:hypothetical protein
MAKYRKKPVVIDAMQFTNETKDRIFFQFVTCRKYADHDSDGNPTLKIETPEGVMTASVGDWIIKGIAGEFYPCKDEVFRATYELVGKND